MRLSYIPPQGWDFTSVGELAKSEKGSIRIGPFGSALKKHEYSEKGVRVLGIEDVHPNQLLTDRCKYIPEAKFRELTQYEVSDGDVLVTNMGTVGRACFVPAGTERSIISSHLIKVSLDPSKADPNYFCWMLNFSPLVVAQIKAKCHGAIMAGFNSSLLKSLQIPLPPLPEQKRIAGILDAADALRAKRRESLVQLDTLLQSTFLDIFGDPLTYVERYDVCELSAVCEKITDGEHGTVGRVESGRRYLMARNVTRELTIDLSDVSYIAEADHQRIYKRCNPLPGDLLLVCVGATIGKIALVPEMEEFSLARSVSLIKPDRRRLEPYFLLHLFDSDYVQLKLVGQRNVAAQAGLYLSKIRGLEVPVPPFRLQRRFAAIVESVEQQKAHQRAHLDELDTLFASLHSRAFRGDL